MGTNSTPRGLAIACALILSLTLGTLAPGWSSAARGAHGPGNRAWPPRVEFAPAANARPLVGAHRIVLAHLDEESVPAAENPGAPALDGSAPETNPGPSAEWEQLPAAGEPPSSAISAPAAPAANAAAPAKAASSANAASAAGGGTSAAAMQSAKSGPAAGANSGASAGSGNRAADMSMKPAEHPQAQPAAPIATVASVQPAPAADANNAAGGAVTGSAGGQEANPEPPPALDLGAMQSVSDLAALSLASEIKRAETPARAAALRVTEQARVELAAGRTDDALRALGRAVSIDPGNPFEYFYLGRAYIARRNYAQALTFLKRAEIGFGARPDWLGETVGFEGACYEELSQTTDAALAYRRALGSAPNNLRARVGFSRLGGDLPSAASADASTTPAPAREALPPPERAAAGPAPAEAPPPPPPAPLAPESAAKKIPAADYQPDQRLGSPINIGASRR